MISHKNYLLMFWEWLMALMPIGWKYRLHRCMEPGCGQPGEGCFLPDDETIPSFYYCSGHCYENGFCWGCGQFYAGMESFDFNFSKCGLCENCDDEFSEDEDDNDLAWMGDGLP